MSFNNVAIVYVKRSAYRIHFWYTSKDDAINIINGSNLADKKVFYNFFILYKCFHYIKMCESADLTYYKKNRDTVLNRAKDYYENDKKD